MKVTLCAYTPNPEIVVAAAGMTCYSSKEPEEIYGTITKEEAASFIKRTLLPSGHTSPLEHAAFTFAVSGISRSLLAQATRHRIASFSVQSQRYVNMEEAEYVIPESIQRNPFARRIFNEFLDTVARAYKDIHNYLLSTELREKYGHLITHEGLNQVFKDNPKFFHVALQSHMEHLMQEDPSESNTALYQQYRKDYVAASKWANENARAVLPNAACSNYFVTMNARELRHFFDQRCCNRAQDEIRNLADLMLECCREVSPSLFEKAGAPCIHGSCPEGKMSCGNPRVATEKNSKGGKENG